METFNADSRYITTMVRKDMYLKKNCKTKHITMGNLRGHINVGYSVAGPEKIPELRCHL